MLRANKKLQTTLRRVWSCFILFFFCGRVFAESFAYAQDAGSAYLNTLTGPQERVEILDKPLELPSLSGLQFFPQKPFEFTFYLDSGNTKLTRESLESQAKLLIKYFLTALTTQENDLWVNLSPVDKDRIVPESFGETELGRDLLAQDYLLKQLTSSLMYPEEKIGQAFWQKIYQKISQSTPQAIEAVNALNRVWIVPEKAVIYRNGNKVFIANCRLKVLSEQDYAQSYAASKTVSQNSAETIAQEALKNIIIPKLEKEVNEGQSFALLRQIYHSVILAGWYKKHLRDSVLGQIYVEKNKTSGLNCAETGIKHKIYERYLQSYQKGIYNYIREDFDPISQSTIPRKYFSGGVQLTDVASAGVLNQTDNPDDVIPSKGDVFKLDAVLAGTSDSPNSLSDAHIESVESTAAGPVDLSEVYFSRVAKMAVVLLNFVKTQESLAEFNQVSGNLMGDAATQNLLEDILALAGIDQVQYFNKSLDRKHLTDAQKAVLARVDAIEQQLRSYKKSTRLYFADFGTVLAAFLGEQAIYGQDYFNVYLPRDMGYGFTIQKTLAQLGVVSAQDVGIFYLSRASFGQEYYEWFKQQVLDLRGKVESSKEFMNKITDIVKERIDKDMAFKDRLVALKGQIDKLGYSQKRKVRFIDSSTGRFPTLFQVIFKIYYPEIETKGLVIESFDEKLMPQFDTGEWRQEIVEDLKKDQGTNQIMRNKVAADLERVYEGSGPTTKRFFHSFTYNEEQGELQASGLHEILMADWIALAFMMGTSRYYLMVKALQADLVGQGMDADLAQTVAVKVVSRIVGDTEVTEDYTGVTQAAVESKAKPPTPAEVNQMIDQAYSQATGNAQAQTFGMSPSLSTLILPESKAPEESKGKIKKLVVGLFIALGIAAYWHQNNTPPPKPTTVKQVSAQAAAFVYSDTLSLGAQGPAFEEFKNRLFAVIPAAELIKAVEDLSGQTNPLTGKKYDPQLAKQARTIVGKALQATKYTRDFQTVIVAIQESGGIRPDGDVGQETREFVRKMEHNPPKSSSAVGGIAFFRDISWVKEIGAQEDLASIISFQNTQNPAFDGLIPLIIKVEPVAMAGELKKQ